MNHWHMHKLRADLPPLTPRIARLPVDERGYPVPFFVTWLDGKPEFRMADGRKLRRCLAENLCWCCGEKLGAHKAFIIGPMCAINRITSEPPSHLECAEWSVRGCPFMTKPQMIRREDELTRSHEHEVAGIMIKRNPGASCVWVTKTFKKVKAPNGLLMEVGDPESVSWWREGRPATRAEVMESINTALRDVGAPQDEIDRRLKEIECLLPPS